ncbi:hypothetical protein Heshes_26270 [Alicyclobacillus hesperidum]|uniref:Lipoprotein n=1 Tax=Alicyclobacillus hesperidum TaxID=89784 RepID=A0AA37TZN2_9BACL|nr:hypothetical protein [Alicyclobacillus hesperidum]GLV14942.1 hypothetical protein Heshes_26270 [Alicyclobacillus hesperidum]
MKKIFGLLVVVLGLSGCGTTQSYATLPSGTILGWKNHMYKIVGTTSSYNVGKKLGTVSYHGKVSGVFTIFELKGTNFTRAIVFRPVFGSSNGWYYEANVQTNGSQ